MLTNLLSNFAANIHENSMNRRIIDLQNDYEWNKIWENKWNWSIFYLWKLTKTIQISAFQAHSKHIAIHSEFLYVKIDVFIMLVLRKKNEIVFRKRISINLSTVSDTSTKEEKRALTTTRRDCWIFRMTFAKETKSLIWSERDLKSII